MAQIRRLEAVEKKLQLREPGGPVAPHKFFTIFPDQGPLRRELYPKHLEFFQAGKEHMERCFMAGNRVGKTEAGAYEMTCHLTGSYPAWWEGHRCSGPITAWAAGDTHKTVRAILQEKFLGIPGQQGTGMIPGHLIHKVTHKAGTAEAVDTIYVRHATGAMSRLTLKSYQEGRRSFQGTGVDVVWFDEEVPMDIYVEGLARLMTTQGKMMLTFTPLNGLTEVVLKFLPAG
jgi:phage terminase large subunit-like protein